MNTRNKKRYNISVIATIAVFLICISVALIWLIQLFDQESDLTLNPGMIEPSTSAPSFNDSSNNENNTIDSFAKDHNLSLRDWPDSLIELLAKNPEATDFVLNYPLKKDLKPDIDLSAYVNCNKVPFFYNGMSVGGILSMPVN